MDISITFEWSTDSGLPLSKLYPVRNELHDQFLDRNYGISIDTIWLIIVCMESDYRRRTIFRAKQKRFEYDIYIDLEKMREAGLEEKKQIVIAAILTGTENNFSKQKVPDFNKEQFLADLKEILNNLKW